MTVTLVNPEGLPETGAYHHVSVATGSKLVLPQRRRRPGRGRRLLRRRGEADRLRRRLDPDKLALYQEGVSRAAAKLGVNLSRAPGSLLGITAGFTPDLRVEVEAIAVID